jgi:NADH-quinone oxidoreductase subunit L
MPHALNMMLPSLMIGADAPVAGPAWAGWILWLPAISLALCGLCAAFKVRSKLPAWITVVCLGISFFVTLSLYLGHSQPVTVHLFRWFDLHWQNRSGAQGSFVANFALYVDSLTLLWMLFVTGLGTLIALYASEYMEPDVGRGYARFFAGVSVFLFAMSCLVIGDNLIMLYLGWEGVGFASYWLIGYYYTRPSAVAAAKKAFIMNRIGDLGLALGIYLIYHAFGTVEYADLFRIMQGIGNPEQLGELVVGGSWGDGGWKLKAIPFLLMLGAFGKSAQFPLFVWLPDAMEGPTPVSALIHAATMVTAGVYLLARMFPLMHLNDAALPTVAWIGGGTALLAATIGMAQYDIKRIMAYSTVSQLGYMFVGIGVLTTYGAAYHVFTHAFFKAVLFLTCGAVMHGFAGQLDLRKLSGLRKMDGWQIVSYTMLIGCLCLAGFPFTSGFFSKDAIIAEAFVTQGPSFQLLGWVLLFTAGLTAYYTFRVWFRVCAGPVSYEMGDEQHAPARSDGHGHHDAEDSHEAHAHHDHKPHPPKWAINGVLVIIAIGALLAAIPQGWVRSMVDHSSAAVAHAADSHAAHGESDAGRHGSFIGMDPHKVMYYVSGLIGIVGIAIAFYLHLANRKAADSLRAKLLANPATRWLPTAMERKWYVDELYDALVRYPLWWISQTLNLIDRWVIDWLIVDGIARFPRWMGRSFQPLQNGILQSYAVSMAGGVGLAVLLVVVIMPYVKPWLMNVLNGGGG